MYGIHDCVKLLYNMVYLNSILTQNYKDKHRIQTRLRNHKMTLQTSPLQGSNGVSFVRTLEKITMS